MHHQRYLREHDFLTTNEIQKNKHNYNKSILRQVPPTFTSTSSTGLLKYCTYKIIKSFGGIHNRRLTTNYWRGNESSFCQQVANLFFKNLSNISLFFVSFFFQLASSNIHRTIERKIPNKIRSTRFPAFLLCKVNDRYLVSEEKTIVERIDIN